MLVCQLRNSRNDPRQALPEQLQGFIDLQRTDRDQNVLRRGAPVQPPAERAALGRQLADQGRNSKTRPLRRFGQGVVIDDRIVQMLPDARAGIGGNDSDLGLGERQRRFDLAALSRPPGRCEQIRDAPVASSHAGLSVQ